MPCTPISPIASRTSSSLKGLMMAVMSFMVRCSLQNIERLADAEHHGGIVVGLAVAVVITQQVVGAVDDGDLVVEVNRLEGRAVTRLVVFPVEVLSEDADQAIKALV